MKTMPKYLIIVLTLVALFSMMLRVGENIEYLSIVAERASVAKTVSTGKADFDLIKEDYENCIYRMQKLAEKSEYGFLLSCIDGMNAGKLVNYVIILGQFLITIMAILVLGLSFNIKIKFKQTNTKNHKNQNTSGRYAYNGKYSNVRRKKKVKTHSRGKYVA